MVFNASDCVCLVLGIGHLSEKGKMEGGQAENGMIFHLLTSPGVQRRVLEKSRCLVTESLWKTAAENGSVPKV